MPGVRCSPEEPDNCQISCAIHAHWSRARLEEPRERGRRIFITAHQVTSCRVLCEYFDLPRILIEGNMIPLRGPQARHRQIRTNNFSAVLKIITMCFYCIFNAGRSRVLTHRASGRLFDSRIRTGLEDRRNKGPGATCHSPFRYET
jgi:hypothetical protein